MAADTDAGDAVLLTVKVRLPAKPPGNLLIRLRGGELARVLSGRGKGLFLNPKLDVLGVIAPPLLASDPFSGMSFAHGYRVS